MGDGAQESWVKDAVEAAGLAMSTRYLVHGPTRDFGNSQREFAYRIAKGDWIMHLDDDDILTQDAFVKIRKALMRGDPRDGFLFKVIAPWREVVWTDVDQIEQGNVCTIQMVLPNPRYGGPPLPSWPKRQGGNIPFLLEWERLADLQNQELCWMPDIIAICRPYKEDVWFNANESV